MFSNPARANHRSILLLKQEYTPVSPSLASKTTSFCSPQPRTVATLHFINNPFRFAPTPHFVRPTSLASSLSLSRFAQSTRLAAQTTRLRLRHLNKPRLQGLPTFGRQDPWARGLSPL
jgi:hypothetical protein